MRTWFLVIAMFAIGACAGPEAPPPAVDEADGIRAVSRAGENCGDACIVTTLTDVATNTQLATVTWDADTTSGTLVEPGRTTQITAEELEEMTPVEANQATLAVWEAMNGRGDGGLPTGAATCNETIRNNGGCTCLTRVCIACEPVHDGEYCSVSVVHYCWSSGPAYQPRCSGTAA
jgi:hypothetical protein